MSGKREMMLRPIDLAFNVGAIGGLSDAELVERFATRRGPAAEAAFAVLVRRHGPMVHRVCRAIVGDHHEAQDASQATFMVLARKAGSIRVGDSLSPWLHGVACRVAAKARASAARRQAHEARAAGMMRALVSDEAREEIGPIVHEEIARLPDRYRVPVILCDLEGRTYEEAARVLGRPIGTIKSRLARGREHLRGRMIRRGVAPAAVVSAGFLSSHPARSAAWSASVEATARLAVQVAAGRAAADLVPSTVLVLMEGALRMSSLSRLKLAVATLVIGCGAFSVPVLRGQANPGETGPSARPTARPMPPPTPLEPPPTASRRTEPIGPPAEPWQTVVRVRVIGTDRTAFGTGTIIRSTDEEAVILTAAHLFKLDDQEPVSPPAEYSRPIGVDLFDGRPDPKDPASRTFRIAGSYTGRAIDFDFGRDVGLISIRPGRRLPASRIVPPHWQPRSGMKMLAMGCSEGGDPTPWRVRITHPRVEGPFSMSVYEAIECETAPRQGRTGWGLFTADGYLAGVCDYAEPATDRGLYASPVSIYRLLDRNHLGWLYKEGGQAEPRGTRPSIALPELDDLIRSAEGQLREGDREDLDRILRDLDERIEGRRKALREELNSLDTTYARRRDELMRRAAEIRPATPPGPAPAAGLPVPGVDPAPEPPSPPRDGAPLGRILEKWARRSAEHTSLDVRFTYSERDSKWGDAASGSGRLFLTSGGRMRVDLDRGTGEARDQERIIWIEEEVHQFFSKSRTHVVWPVSASDRGRLPAFLALPFCWNLPVERMQALFRVELVANGPNGTCLLRFTPRTPAGRESLSRAFVELDLATYLPRRYVLILPDGRSKDFRVTEIQCDRPALEGFWDIPDDRGWTATRPESGPSAMRWFSRLFQPELVP